MIRKTSKNARFTSVSRALLLKRHIRDVFQKDFRPSSSRLYVLITTARSNTVRPGKF